MDYLKINENDFIELFKKYENLTKDLYRKNYGIQFAGRDLKEASIVSISQELYRKGVFPYKNQFNIIQCCAEVRNLCLHENKINGRDIVEPSVHLYNELKKIIDEIEKPKKIYDIAIKISDIYSRSMQDNVKESIEVMNNKKYTHIPIMEDGVCIGVFGEKTLFDYLAENEIVEVDKTTTFEKVKDYLSFQKNDGIVRFERKDMTVEELIKIFKEDFISGQKLECILITQNGKNTEKLIGLLTIWDILGKYVD